MSMNRLPLYLLAAAALAAAFVVLPLKTQAEPAVIVPPPAAEATAPGAGQGLETAVLAGGCFWGIQAVYQHVKGVTNAVSGYAGGTRQDADYETVSSGATGHAESVAVTFDPRQISYGKVLQIYFSVAHDPTQLNYQGPDRGPQYRSEIFPQSEAQQKIAQAYIAQLDQAHVFKRPIVTKTGTMGAAFFPAEAYHQDYAINNPRHPYIVYNDAPKVEYLKRMFAEVWREKARTVKEASKGE
jgi:peptide-methionine (S)-S-oxide reductase